MSCEHIVDARTTSFKSTAVYTNEQVVIKTESNSSEQNNDIFISKSLNQTLVKTGSSGIFAMFSLGIKNFFWAFVSPVIKLLSAMERFRCSWELDKVKNRDNAKTDEEILKYHQSIMFGESNPDEKKIFRYFSSDKKGPKPLMVLFMGNVQSHLWSDSEAGMIRLYDKLKKDNNADVLLFRVGNAADDVKHKLFISNDCSLSTDIVYQHSVNVLEDAISGKGVFSEHHKPSSVSFVGYSWGGGTVDKLLSEDWERIKKDTPVVSTVQIDAINLGVSNISTPVTRRPHYSQRHLNIFQNNYDYLNGCSQYQNKEDESIVLIDPNFAHNTIDDHPEVLSRTYNFLKERMK